MECSRVLVAGLILVLLSGSSPPAAAELASMVADLNLGAGPNPGSDPGSFVRVGPRVLFFATDPRSSERLSWATDGTAAGTRRLATGGGLRQELGLLGDVLLWFGWGADFSGSLWRTGGTPETTYALVPDGVASYDEDPFHWARVEESVYFFRYGESGWQLWTTDGTAAGTRPVASLPVAERAAATAAHGGLLFFVTGRRAGSLPGHAPLIDFKLWRSDGTAAGTRLLGELPGSVRGLRSTRGGLLLFAGDELWVSDGTRSGTHPLFPPPDELRIGPSVTLLADALGGRLFFFESGGSGEATLWVSDGTRRGTRPVASDLFPDSPTTALLGGRLYFTARDGQGLALWSSRGTAATTRRMVDLCVDTCALPDVSSGPRLVAAGGRLFFLADDGVHGVELWTSDGTPAGTRLVRDLCPGHCGLPSALHAADGEVFFYAQESSHGRQLWASDGTEGGTRRLTDSLPDPGFQGPYRSAPPLAALGARVVTVGWDPRGGAEPWVFYRSGRGGEPLGDLATGGEPGARPSSLGALGDRTLFIACDGDRYGVYSSRGTAETTVELVTAPDPGCNPLDLPSPFDPPVVSVVGARGFLRLGDLWVTDGTPGGTVRLTDFGAPWNRSPISTVVVGAAGGAVFATGFSTSSTLWATDGTPEGTRILDLPPLPALLQGLTAVGGDLYFWAQNSETGWGAWALGAGLDSVTRLTSELQDFRFPRLLPPGFLGVGDHVFFLLEGKVVEGDTSHYETRLWRTDGTPEGTVEVPPPAVGGSPQRPTWIAARQGVLLLFTTTTSPAEYRSRLWATDGTEASDGSAKGAVLIYDLGPRSFLGEVVPWDDEVLFLVEHEEDGTLRRRLYRTDGTAPGTFAAVDFAALGVHVAGEVTPAGGRLYLAAGATEAASELWTSEGSQATTRRLQEIAPGAAGSAPDELTVAGSRLFFSADDDLHGRELWSLPLDDLDGPCRPSATALCLGGGRFRAELFRQDRRGDRGAGRAVAWSSAAGAFWFYAYPDPEAVVKMVDGGAVNGSFWLFYGPLTDAQVALTVTDLESGASRRYPPRPGVLGAFVSNAFPSSPPAGAAGAPAEAPREVAPMEVASLEVASPDPAPPEAASVPAGGSAAAGDPCAPTARRLCLQGRRFGVELTWRDGRGVEHPARAFAHADRAGYFAFYGRDQVQAALKLLDGRPINGRFWLFATALTHLEYTLVVTDTATGAVHVYRKPAGEISSFTDLTSLG